MKKATTAISILYAVIMICLIGISLLSREYMLLYWIVLLGLLPVLTIYVGIKTARKGTRISQILQSNGGKWYAGITVLPRWVEPFVQGLFHSYIGNVVGMNNYISRDESWLYLQIDTGFFRPVDENTMTSIERRTKYTLFVWRLDAEYPDMYFDSLQNRSHLFSKDKVIVRANQLVQCEGVFLKDFTIYSQKNQALNVLAIAGPDLLEAIKRYAVGADVYIHNNRLIFIYDHIVKSEITVSELFTNAPILAREITGSGTRHSRKELSAA